jgi:lysyl-tRNA synthetase class 2
MPQVLKEVTVALAGRVFRQHSSGTKLFFYDIRADSGQVQIFVDKRNAAADFDFDTINGALRRGDILGAVGYPGRTQTGELSIFATKLVILAPCLHILPPDTSGLKDQVCFWRCFACYHSMVVPNPLLSSG